MKKIFYNLIAILILRLVASPAMAQQLTPPFKPDRNLTIDRALVNDQPSPVLIEPGAAFILDVWSKYRGTPDRVFWKVWADVNGDGIYSQRELLINKTGEARGRTRFQIDFRTLPVELSMQSLEVVSLKIALGEDNITDACDESADTENVILYYSSNPFTINMGDGHCTCRFGTQLDTWPPVRCHDRNDPFNELFLIRVMKEFNNPDYEYIDVRTYAEVKGTSVLALSPCYNLPFQYSDPQETNDNPSLDFPINLSFNLPGWVNPGDEIDIRFETYGITDVDSSPKYHYLKDTTLTQKVCSRFLLPWLVSPTASVYPNPFKEKLTLANVADNGLEIKAVEVRNALGNTVLKKSASSSKGLGGTELDMHKLPKGVYHITLITEEGEQHQRVVKGE